MDRHQFREGTAEVERLRLDTTQVRAVIIAEIEESERAAAEFSRLARADHAALLREQASIARRYLE